MRRKLPIVTYIIINIIGVSNNVFPQTQQKEPVLQVSLDETINRALDTSEELKIKAQEVNRTQGVYREVRSGMLPHISAETTWTNNLGYPDKAATQYSDHEFNGGVSASQVIWSFGKIIYAVNSARSAVEASVFNKEASKQEVIYAAKLSYYSSVLARNALFITEKSYANVLENKKLMSERTYGGRSPKYEIIRMDAEVASRIPTVNEARTEFDAAMETLRRVIDINLDREIELVGDFQGKYNDYNYETLVTAMYEYEPSLRSLDKTVESAGEKVKSRYASFLPTLSAFGSWSYRGGSNEHAFLNNDELDNYSVAGLKASIPLWEGGEKEAQLSQSKADKEIAVLKKKQLERNLLLELKKAFLEYDQYKENLKANIDAVNLAEESFKQMQEMFASGQVTLTDLNDAELLLTNQRLNKEMTLFSINITLARIEKLIAGQYDEKNINKES
ncbi:MAG: TolC family protein [Candidatus Omnitrophica bacterium]|nr:TolC family protein [Candidatus Omnitrophota bacterium]